MPPKPWEERWHREQGPSFRGGQGASFVAKSREDGETRAFVKTLHRHRERDRKARARFRREAVAYETLAGLGPPALYDHNADTWTDLGQPMFMVLEYIDGPNLSSFIGAHGPVGLDAATECVRKLSTVLHNCHQNNVTHRDVKPANIVLRDGEVTQPVLVDFGLSFNDESEDDLTQVGEEIGNRFLRLPEHAFGGRGAGSDVTQLAGVFLFLLTGCEPRVLIDQSGLMPHQRPGAGDALSEALTDRQRLRILRVFDRAFIPELTARFTTAQELVAQIDRAMATDSQDDGNFDRLMAQMSDFVQSRNLQALGTRREKLDRFLGLIDGVVQSFAKSKGMMRWQSNWASTATAEDEWATVKMALTADSGQPRRWTAYRIEPRGPSEYVVLIDGDEAWRGSEWDPSLKDAVVGAAVRTFLAGQRDDA